MDDYGWLVSAAAEPWLKSAQMRGNAKSELLSLVRNLRKELSPERVHLVIEQVELRCRGKEKFSLAERMFFTRKGLEQATDEWLADYKAARFAAGQPVVDFCCGIGGDLVALGKRGPVRGVDFDPASALLAATNAAAHGLSESQCSAVVQDVREYPLDPTAAWHIDPDRRPEGRRSTRGELFEPSLEAIDGLLARSGPAAVKLAPATEAPQHWGNSAELEWLGSRGECRQQVAWFGSLARHPGRRAATVVDSGGGWQTIVGEANDLAPVAAKLGRFIYEPHTAVLAAKLLVALCREHALEAVAGGIAYLTSDRPIEDKLLAAFEICDVLPFDTKLLKSYCRDHGISKLEIKKRGIDLSIESLRRKVVGTGTGEATIIVTPVDEQVRAIVARRI